jgi:MerR family transcriptional regulator/heat shock protein HspR
MPRRRKTRVRFLRISAVAERFDIHPQTLRLYEREGLITPPRSDGNTRLYDEVTLERLETILTLTRDLGVNLAGVEVILNMREQMESMQIETDRLLAFVKQEMLDRKVGVDRKYALVKVQSGPLAAAAERQKTASTARRKTRRGKRHTR